MSSLEKQTVNRVLLADYDDVVRDTMSRSLQAKGFQIVAVGWVTEALNYIATESFEMLITDLHMTNAGDDLTVISAMRRSQPTVELKQIADLVRERLRIQKLANRPTKERMSETLDRCSDLVVKDWLVRVKQARELNHLVLGDEERAGHLPKLIQDLILCLNRPSTGSPQDDDAIYSPAAVLHGKLRYEQGYTPEMLTQESRILEASLFGTLRNNMNAPDFGLVLQDIITTTDEVHSQLARTIGSYLKQEAIDVGRPLAWRVCTNPHRQHGT